MAIVEVEPTDGVSVITMNRPEALNAFTTELMEAIIDAVKAAGKDDNCQCLILKGSGRAFSAGVDLKMLQKATFNHGFVDGVFSPRGADMARVLRASRKPIIAQVHGACFTGALEVALNCDFILTTVDTKFGDTHAKFGLRPSWGMSQLLPQAVGMRRARQMSYSAMTIKGDLAERWGLANIAYSDTETLEAETLSLAKRIASNSPGALAAHRDLFQVAEESRSMDEALKEELARDYPQITDTVERLKGFGL